VSREPTVINILRTVQTKQRHKMEFTVGQVFSSLEEFEAFKTDYEEIST